MRVLVLTADCGPRAWSGIGAAVAVQAAALSRQGLDVEVVLPPERGSPPVPTVSGPRFRTLTPTRFPSRLEGVDIVHLHSLGLAELAIEIRRRFGIPLVYTAHASVDAEVPAYGRWSGWSDVQELVVASSDHVIFTSSSERRSAARRSRTVLARSSVHPNGVEPRSALPPRASVDGPIVFAGRFAVTKGLGLLAEIADLLGGHSGLRLVLAGGHGDAEGRRRVAALVARHPSWCREVGWLAPAALERLYRSAGIVLVPSSYEPFGMVAIEAMRAGAPVLAAATGGLREVVGPGSGGELVHSRRAEAWRDAIVALLESLERRRALSHRGPRYVAERYDPDVLARSLIADVYEPLGRRSSRPALGAAS